MPLPLRRGRLGGGIALKDGIVLKDRDTKVTLDQPHRMNNELQQESPEH